MCLSKQASCERYPNEQPTGNCEWKAEPVKRAGSGRGRLIRVLRRHDFVRRGDGQRRVRLVRCRWRRDFFRSRLRPRTRNRFNARRNPWFARLRQFQLFLHLALGLAIGSFLRFCDCFLALLHLLLNVMAVSLLLTSLRAHGRATIEGETERDDQAEG
jgi:hypothetical protein